MSNDQPSISVVIPAYNEAAGIRTSVQEIQDFFEARNWPVQIIVVDDGSTDRTAFLADQVGAEVIRLDHNRGKGASVAVGMAAVENEWALLTDADLATPISTLEQLLNHTSRADIVIGSRTAVGAVITQAQSRLRQAAGSWGNSWIRLVLSLPYTDTQCGFKLFNRSARQVFARQRITRFGFDFEALVIARRWGLRIAEVGVPWAHDPQTSVRWTDYPRTILDVLRVRYYDWKGYYAA